MTSGRPLRAAVSLLLAIVLVAGGASLRPAPNANASVGSALVAEVAAARRIEAVPGDGERIAGVLLTAAPLRTTPRWRDLRRRGLPAPRAPDRAATPHPFG